MTKRYNMFNYIETWAGIILLLVNIPVLYFAYTICKQSEFTITYVLLSFVCIVIILSSTIKNGKKLIITGMNKAFDCDDGYIYGRVRSRESDKNYMIHHLDCIKALEYCNKDDCIHCPFRISCKQTNYLWMIEGSRLLIKQYMPTNTNAKKITDIIDRYYNCKEEYCTYEDCQFFDQCLQSQKESVCKQLHAIFKKYGYTSADNLRR